MNPSNLFNLPPYNFPPDRTFETIDEAKRQAPGVQYFDQHQFICETDNGYCIMTLHGPGGDIRRVNGMKVVSSRGWNLAWKDAE